MIETTQAVVDEAKATAEPIVEADKRTETDADLDTLLAEYDQSTKPAVSPPETKAETKPSEPVVSDRVRRLEERLFQEDINEAASAVFDGLDHVGRRGRVGFLDQMARENPALGKAFLNKEGDPQGWKRILKSLAKEAQKEFGTPVDKDATADREAVAAAVRGASAKVAAEPPPRLGGMSNGEFQKYTRENFGF